MQHRITIEGSSAEFACRGDQSVLDAMAGRSHAAIAIGCRSGGCGVCRVQVLSGSYELGVMSIDEVTHECRSKAIVLACRLTPSSDLHLRALGKRVNRCAQLSTAELIRSLTTRSSSQPSSTGTPS